MHRSIARWLIDHDAEATRRCYASRPTGAGCECAYCRNAEQLGEKVFPRDFLDVLKALGIDPTKPVELMHYCKESSGVYSTGGFFHFVGSIISGEDAFHWHNGTGSARFEDWNSAFQFGLTKQVHLVADVFDGLPLVQLEFVARIPWVLNEPEPE